MELMVKEVYDALLEAGASEQSSAKAAAAVASYENRMLNLENKVDRLAIELRIYSGILGVLILGTFARLLTLK